MLPSGPIPCSDLRLKTIRGFLIYIQEWKLNKNIVNDFITVSLQLDYIIHHLPNKMTQYSYTTQIVGHNTQILQMIHS